LERMNVQQTIESLREALQNTPYEGKVFLVGGYVRDKRLNRPLPNDVDLVLEGDGLSLAQFLYEQGTARYKPVLYPRFGTAMVIIEDVTVEIVTARAESYRNGSRKPIKVQPASLQQDAMRRDFTINALLENLHTGEVIDLLGTSLSDLQSRLLRTPLEPKATFHEDPLRMLRAVRFSVQLDFNIEPKTYKALRSEASRLSIISTERIREEFNKILDQPAASKGLQMLLETGLLAQFAPELLPMIGCTQNEYHQYDVWTHTLKAIDALPPASDWKLRLATLLHDVAKPMTRSMDEKGHVHFYDHQHVGAKLAKEWLRRMKYSNDVIEWVSRMVEMHMRPGEYTPRWSDAAVRRLIRDAGELLEPLLVLCEADGRARRADIPLPDLAGLCKRIESIREKEDTHQWQSPLSGEEIMELLNLTPGPLIGKIKDALAEQVIEGSLSPDDKPAAVQRAVEVYKHLSGIPLDKSG
jgi:poly(A) polymerase